MDQLYRPTSIPDRSDLFLKSPVPQTLFAWEPFWECVGTNFQLQNSDIDDEHPEWRMHWVYAISLLRTIGHVLDKIDSQRCARHKQIIETVWEEWKSDTAKNWIFWEFIEKERNNLLKTFNFGVEVDQHGLWYTSLNMDGVQLIREATYWWRDQLEFVEQKLEIPNSG